MKKSIVILIVIFNSLTSSGQQKSEPQILILTPHSSVIDKKLQKEVNSINQVLSSYKDSKKEEYLKSSEFLSKSENIRKIVESEYNYSKSLDLIKMTSYISEQHLSYTFFRKFPNLIIELSELRSTGELDSLKSIAEQYKFQYVLNFSQIELYQVKKQKFAKITLELYDHATNRIVISKSYIGDWSNPGFEFTCEDESINCTINNALAQALPEIVYEIANNNSTILLERKIQKERDEYLINQFSNKLYDNTYLTKISTENNLNFDPSKSFQCIIKEDQSMFVAFFVEKKKYSKNDEDKNVNIISNDGGFSNIPDNFGYILSGFKYQNKWYFEKTNTTYFEANNLTDARSKYFQEIIKMNYFQENSTEINPEFWNSNSFEKVESEITSKKESIDYHKNKIADSKDSNVIKMHQEFIAEYYQHDEENKEYIGMYKLVVDDLKLKKEKEDSLFYSNIKTNVLDPYFSKSINQNGIVKITTVKSLDYPLTLIYPSDKTVLIAPCVTELSDKKYDFNFYVLIPLKNNQFEIYQWTYFNTTHPKSDEWVSSEVTEKLKTITHWNFTYKFLNDPDFWSKYVLIKESGNYKYLQKLN